MKSILFICTGNVFRSVTAEYALKTRMGPDVRLIVGSAGIEARPQPLHPMIIEYLRAKGADPSAHVQRKLTHELLEGVDLAVAMGLDHRDFIRKQFSRDVPLFNQVCFEKEESVLDLHEVMPDWASNMDQARAYVQSVVDHIWEATPALLARLPSYRL
ncbi:MAG: low molecular weight phosphatase family protein [Burkholderiales bacterium]